MNAHKLKLVHFYKFPLNLYFPLIYNSEIGTEPSMSESDSRTSPPFYFIITPNDMYTDNILWINNIF